MLLEFAIERQVSDLKNSYEYYVFLDEDVAASTLRLTDALDIFEKYLLEKKPAVGYPKHMIPWRLDVQDYGIFNVDAVINAFHKTTIGLLVPYCSSLDHKSWYYRVVMQQFHEYLQKLSEIIQNSQNHLK